MPSAAFDVLPGSVMKSIRHRWLLKEWELGRAGRPLPPRAHLAREEFNLYRGEFSVFELRHESAGLRFLLSAHGAFIGRAYGSNCVGKYLDQIVPADLHGQQIEPYRQAARQRRPVYVSSDTRTCRESRSSSSGCCCRSARTARRQAASSRTSR
jgi:hypothetical protein